MHPSARILIAILSALVLPGLSFFYLAVLSLPLGLLGLASPRRMTGLLSRARWFFLGIVLVYAYQLPGPALVDGWAWGPSQTGLEAGVMQAWRLAAMLLLIDILLLRMPVETLLSGLFILLAPLKWLGLPIEGIAVRLGLTLNALAQGPQRGMSSFSIEAAEARAADLPTAVTIRQHPWHLADSVSVITAFLLVAWSWQAA